MSSDDNNARRRWMGILAKALPEEVEECWSKIEPPPSYDLLRRPETGLVMVRGRVGGDGAPFNLGEMTVTRCSVRLATGVVGHAWIAGRAAAQAERAALIDALLQSPGGRADIEALLEQLAARGETRKREAARKAAATRVDFFTMARGED